MQVDATSSEQSVANNEISPPKADEPVEMKREHNELNMVASSHHRHHRQRS